MPFIEPHSICSIPLELYSEELLLGTATGFLWKYGASSYVVSNWHVFSGRRSDTGQPNSKTMRTPTRLALRLHESDLGKTTERYWLDLYDAKGESVWFQHADGQDQDVAAIGLCASLSSGKATVAIQDLDNGPIRLRAGLATVSLGFPRGLVAQGAYPIWKSGSIAAEPTVARTDGQQFYLIDGASREGMSGAPVFAIANGVFQDHFGNTIIDKPRTMKFIGIYSGRYANPDEKELQLVRAWPTAAITQLFEDQVPGSYELRKLDLD